MLLLNKNLSIKKLTLKLKNSGGRNFFGCITINHRGNCIKKRYRLLDFFRKIKEIPGIVRKIEYDPNRNGFISLICYKNSILSYILASDYLKIGDIIINSFYEVLQNRSNSTRLFYGNVGIYIYNLEYYPNFGGKFLRSAGSFGQILKKLSEKYILIRMKSKEMRLFHKNCFFSYGVVSNKFEKFVKYYKAGQTRYKGYRPVVRGEAKNAVDHPHGGNTSGGKQPMTPKGIITRCIKTRNLNKKTKNMILKKRFKK